MLTGHAHKPSEVPVSFIARVVEDPLPGEVDAGQVLVLQLAVPVWAEDFRRGTFPVEAVTTVLDDDVLHRLAIGCRLRVTGSLDMGESRVPGWEHRVGLRVRVEEVSLDEIDLAAAEPRNS